MWIKKIKNAFFWLYWFLRYVACIIFIGAALGALLFVSLGHFFYDESLLFFLKKGIKIGAHYAGVWAGGLSLVLCTIKAYGYSQHTNQ